MQCDILHTVAKLQGSLQSNDLDLSIIPTMGEGTLSRLKELKETSSSSTWFKNHSLVFSDPELLGKRNITVTESDKFGFIDTIYTSLTYNQLLTTSPLGCFHQVL